MTRLRYIIGSFRIPPSYASWCPATFLAEVRADSRCNPNAAVQHFNSNNRHCREPIHVPVIHRTLNEVEPLVCCPGHVRWSRTLCLQWWETGLKNLFSDWHIPNYLKWFEVTFRSFRPLRAWRIPYYLKQLIAHWLFQSKFSSMVLIHKSKLPYDEPPTRLTLSHKKIIIDIWVWLCGQ